MPTWLSIVLGVVGAIGTGVAVYTAVRNARRADRDRVAAYLDRIATMLADMAGELEREGQSHARCAELVEAIGYLPGIAYRSGAAHRAGNELLETLITCMDPPAWLSGQSASGALFAEVSVRLKDGATLRRDDLATIRRAAGMFKGAAEAVRAT